MKIGDQASVSRAFTAAEVDAYVALGGERPPRGEAPPVLLGGLITYLLGVELPGPGANYLKQETDYLSEPRLGETIAATVEVTRLRPEKHLVDLATSCVGEDGRILCRGRTLIFVGDRPAAPGDQGE